jgi:hypothetical protein
MGEIIYRKLKSIEKIKMLDYITDWWDNRSDCTIEMVYNNKIYLTINDEMISKFGDGQEYEFESYNGGIVYNYICLEDNWHYHDSWFEDEEWLLDDKDFLI